MKLPYSEVVFQKCKEDLYSGSSMSDLDRAVAYYYVSFCAYRGRMDNPLFMISTSADSNRADTYRKNLIWILQLSKRLQSVEILSRDFRKVLPSYNSEVVFVYADCPYLGMEDYYDYVFLVQDHEDLARMLKEHKGKFALSSKAKRELRKLYRSDNHYVLNFEDTYRLPDKRHREQLIMNFKTTYAYDGMDRLTEKKNGADTTTYHYDTKGLLLKVTDKSGDITYAYDKYNRISSVTDARGNQVSYTYDTAGRIKTIDNGFGKTTYEYDVTDRITRVIDRNGTATIYEYDELGNRSAVRNANGTIVTYTYDACQRLKEECINRADGTQLAKYTYGLGKAGERKTITETGNGKETTITYEYDKLLRLTKETIERDETKLTQAYQYDAVSNRIAKETTIKGDITVLADIEKEEIKLTEGTTTYTYNALNQLITETAPDGTTIYTYDENGNLIRQSGEKTVDYSYDKENHLMRATIQKGNSVTIESYTYDYAGNRTSKRENEKAATYYINDISGSLTMVIAETDEAGNEIASYTRGDELLSMEKEGEIWYYLYDGHGSVRSLTDKTGNITDRYSYDAYGNLLEKEGETKNEFLYTGEQYNANTGLYYLRARYMNPSTGTFISMDSYQGSTYDPVTLHKYLYANANPVMYTDPSGFVGTMADIIAGQECATALGAITDEAEKTDSDENEKKEKTHVVYTLIDSEGVVRYVGRTNDYGRRMKEHKNPGGKMHDYNLDEGNVYKGLTKEQARGLEQSLIVLHHTRNFMKDSTKNYYNFINGVSKKNKKKKTYHKAAKDYIEKYPDLFENLVEEELNAIKENINTWW